MIFEVPSKCLFYEYVKRKESYIEVMTIDLGKNYRTESWETDILILEFLK